MEKRVVKFIFLSLLLVLLLAICMTLASAFNPFSEIYASKEGQVVYSNSAHSNLDLSSLDSTTTGGNVVRSYFDNKTESLSLVQSVPNAKKDYIVEFKSPPLLAEKEKGEGMGAMSEPSNYKQELKQEHENALADIETELKPTELPEMGFWESIVNFIKRIFGITGRAIEENNLVPKKEFYNVFNGVVLELTQEEAIKIKSSEYVKEVYPNRKVQAYLQDSIPLINADDYWYLDSEGHNCTLTGKPCMDGEGIKIGIVDTGIDYTHPDLGGCLGAGCKVEGGYDIVNQDNDPMDDAGHGTHCAGITAGNGVLKGVAPKAKLYAFKVLDSGGSGTWEDVVEGIERAVDPNQDGDFSDKMDIISLSLGGRGDPDDPVSKSIDRAVESGVVAVIAAGNSGPGAQTIGSPGTSRKAITVGATYKKSYNETFQWGDTNPLLDQIASFSSVGPVVWANKTKYLMKPDIAAPGALICSARYDTIFPAGEEPPYAPCIDEKHVLLAGTSMAAPMVAGAAALIKQAHPSWTPEQVKYSLMGTAKDLGREPEYQGRGRLNLSMESYANIVRIDEIDLTNPFVIKGKIDIQNFASYTLYLYDWGERINISSGTSVPSEILGTYDIGLLRNGDHRIVLEVKDTYGNVYSDESRFDLKKLELVTPSEDSVLNNKEIHTIKLNNKISGLVFDKTELVIVNMSDWRLDAVLTKGITKISDSEWWWDSSLYEGGAYKIRINTEYKGVNDSIEAGVFLDKNLRAGWPKSMMDASEDMGGGMSMTLSLVNQPTIYDLDNDGKKELIFAYGENRAEGDNNSKVYAFKPDGTQLTGFPVALPAAVMQYGPVAGDFDKDGYGEIIVKYSYWWDQGLFKIQHDGSYTYELTSLYLDSLFSGDINDDGYNEFYGLDGMNLKADVFRDNLKRFNSNWPLNLKEFGLEDSYWNISDGAPFSGVMEIPFLIDYNNDGVKEFLFQTRNGYWEELGGGWFRAHIVNSSIYLTNFNGDLLEGFPKNYNKPFACISAADLYGNRKESLLCVNEKTVENDKNYIDLYLINKSLDIEKGFSYEFSNTNQSSYEFYGINIGEIDGKKRITLSGRENYRTSTNWWDIKGDVIALIDIETGGIEVLNGNKEVYNGQMYSIGKISSSANTDFSDNYGYGIYDENDNYLQSGGTVYFKDRTGKYSRYYMNDIGLGDGAVISDIDNNGKNEIISISWDGSIYVWNTEGTGLDKEWNEIFYDSEHSNCYKCSRSPGLHNYTDVGAEFDMDYTYYIGESKINASIVNLERSIARNINYKLEISGEECYEWDKDKCSYILIKEGTLAELQIDGKFPLESNYAALQSGKTYLLKLSVNTPIDDNLENNIAHQQIYAKTSGVDLRVYAWGNEQFFVNKPNNVSIDIYNNGNKKAENVNVSVYYSKDRCWEIDGCDFEFRGSWIIGEVENNSHKMDSMIFTPLEAGEHTLLFVANATQETEPRDNDDFLTFTAKNQGPDAAIYISYYLNEGGFFVNKAGKVAFETENDGTEKATNVKAYLYEVKYLPPDYLETFILIDTQDIGNVDVKEVKMSNFSWTPSHSGDTTLYANISSDKDVYELNDYDEFYTIVAKDEIDVKASYLWVDKSLYIGKESSIYGELINLGKELAEINVSVFDNGNLIKKEVFDEFHPGERKSVYVSYTPTTIGKHKIKLVAEVPGDVNLSDNSLERDVFVYTLSSMTFRIKDSQNNSVSRYVYSNLFQGIYDPEEVKGEKTFKIANLSETGETLELQIYEVFGNLSYSSPDYLKGGFVTLIFNSSFNENMNITSEFHNKTTEDSINYYVVFANRIPTNLGPNVYGLVFNKSFLNKTGVINISVGYKGKIMLNNYDFVYCKSFDFLNKKCLSIWKKADVVELDEYYDRITVAGISDSTIEAFALTDFLGFDGNTTNLTRENNTIINFTIERVPYGKIVFRDEVNISRFKKNPDLLTEYVRIGQGVIRVDTGNLSELSSKKAGLTFGLINLRNPLIYYNGVLCNSTLCTNKAYNSSSKILRADVERFSSFEIIEGPYCGDTHCQADIGEDCSECVADCGCSPGSSCISGSCKADETPTDNTKTGTGDNPITLCPTNWNCTWTPCTNNLQTFNCVDKNKCGTISGRPSDNGKTRACLINKDCVDNDKDGYGVGKDCLGPDINDNDPGITDTIPSNEVENPDTAGERIKKFLRDNLFYIIIVLICLVLIVAVVLIAIVITKAIKKREDSGIEISENKRKEKTRKFE